MTNVLHSCHQPPPHALRRDEGVKGPCLLLTVQTSCDLQLQLVALGFSHIAGVIVGLLQKELDK